MDPTLKSDQELNVGLNPQKQKLKLDQAGLMLLRKDQLEAQSSKAPTPPMFPQDPPRGDAPPPPPPPSPVKKHNTPKSQNAHPGGSVASLLAQFQQSQHSRSWNVSPKSTPTKDTLVKDVPTKDTPKKGEQMPAKKLLMPDKSTEPPVKKQQTSSPSSDRGTMARQAKARKRRKRKRKSLRVSPPWLPTLKQRRLKSSRKNASRRGSGRRSCRY